MYIFPLIIIALCEYTSIAGCCGGDNGEAIDLDINTRESTDRVNVTKKEDGNMVIYKIEPKSGYKIGKFVNGGEVIYEPKHPDIFKYLKARCPKGSPEIFIVTLYYSPCRCIGPFGLNYYIFSDKWRMMTNGFHEFIYGKLKEGNEINRETVIQEYISYIEGKKRNVDIDIDSKKSTPDVKKTNTNELGIDVCLYETNSNALISSINSGSSVIWKKEEGVYGCYRFKVYKIGDAPWVLMATIREISGYKDLHFAKRGDEIIPIEKDEFDTIMNDVVGKSEMKLELAKKKMKIDISKKKPNVSGVTKEDGKEEGVDIRTFTVDDKTVIGKVYYKKNLLWERKGTIYGCYKIKMYYLNEKPELFVLSIKDPGEMTFLYYKKDEDKFISVEKDVFDERLDELIETMKSKEDDLVEVTVQKKDDSQDENVQEEEEGEEEDMASPEILDDVYRFELVGDIHGTTVVEYTPSMDTEMVQITGNYEEEEEEEEEETSNVVNGPQVESEADLGEAEGSKREEERKRSERIERVRKIIHERVTNVHEESPEESFVEVKSLLEEIKRRREALGRYKTDDYFESFKPIVIDIYGEVDEGLDIEEHEVSVTTIRLFTPKDGYVLDSIYDSQLNEMLWKRYRNPKYGIVAFVTVDDKIFIVLFVIDINPQKSEIIYFNHSSNGWEEYKRESFNKYS